ncbi:GNAT family N-acetyltransferase [Flammeovirga yaeyamensis]|uniref:GNAT family N-acetyltransferase n=1 Tax=Flammeovirga yaeyamensis TaxID=367791 RepID=A0AAX1N3I0_9BACT|nr:MULTISPECIES: GNAT family N-acetyltransferase [Flammeovirga]ANQ47959.2 GNAT family N-acetyltransferase [Flammeovirga sp. MY04]MBB3700878.1 GNAT superfamily N-acetyltransferase [Flammeovirga yaeyamensis]NMF37986.1 GNAT family N-acetyltransferase [Flammeovirga yaeyamensis]QWG00637.1 GNAT family N-acetyltransferase [Flammeovirga yaeyamensis]
MIQIIDGNFEELWNIYSYSFPEDEQRSKEDILQLMHEGELHFKGIYEHDTLYGLIAYRQLDNFIYIEYYAMAKESRGLGLGTRFLNFFTQQFRHYCIVLEVEKPTSEVSQKRIKFYEKSGFKFNNNNFEQPPLTDDGNAVPMNLMSWPILIEDTGFEMVKDILYKKVYHLV